MNWFLLFLILFFNVADIITTNIILMHGGKELNPVMSFLMKHLDIWWWVPKFAFFIIVSVILLIFSQRLGLVALTLVSFLIVCWNVFQIFKMKIM